MPKYENDHIANMKISTILIIGFTNFVFCSDQNITDDSHSVCPIKFFRQKRATPEYTRWRANIESTPEFIVKVLDDDIAPLPKTKRVIAVNIQPVTKEAEKIIVGGVMVTVPASKATSIAPETIIDYTRFVPPTTTAATRVEGDVYLAPVQAIQHPILDTEKQRAKFFRPKNPRRDESPPASPQFLPHSPIAGARQYAPITPVGFNRRTSMAPLTPPSYVTADTFMFQKSNPDFLGDTFEDFLRPTRTPRTEFIMDESEHSRLFENDKAQYLVTRTTTFTQTHPDRTTKKDSAGITHTNILLTTERTDDYVEKGKDDKDFEAPYSIFENYEDESGSKGVGKEFIDNYEDKSKEQDRHHISETDVTKDRDSFIHDAHNIIKDDNAIKNGDSTIKSDYYTKKDKAYNVTIIPNARKLLEPEDDVIKTLKTSNTTTDDISSTVIPIEIVTEKNAKHPGFNLKNPPVCSMIKLREQNFISPRTLPEIEAKLKQWAEESPVAKWVDITDGNFTTMERPIYMMIVDDPSSGQVVTAKQTVMIVAGIQGKDHHAVAAAMYVLYQLIERTEAHSDLLTKYRFWIIPVFNPDGYDYAMTFPHRREWAKNLRQNWEVCKGRAAYHACESFGLRCTIQSCYGVNLDRNFEYQWIPADELRAEHPCGPLYAGKRQLSEIETNAFVKYLHDQHRPIYTFIAFKEGDVLGVMYPYSHTKKKRAFEHIYKQRASRAAAAAYSISGRPYVAGQTSQFLPLYAGGIEDWVDGHLGVDNTYTIMMFRPSDLYHSKSITERVVHEAYAAMDTLVIESLEAPPGPVQRVSLVRAKDNTAVANTTHVSVVILTYVTALHLLCFT